MPRLILLRHAKSQWPEDVPDFDRPLADRGETDAPRMGAWLAAQGFRPTVVVSSPALRAHQTCLAAIEPLGFDPDDVDWRQELYGADVTTLLAVLASLPDAETVLLVGHNPTMATTVQHLVPDVPVPSDGKLMPTATAAVIDVPSWPPRPAAGRLVALQRPRDL